MIDTARRFINRLGFDVVRRHGPDLSAYDGYPKDSVEERRFYNVGAGGFAAPYWTSVDLASDYYATGRRQDFVHYDLMALAPLPISDNIAELVYCSHTIEHVTDQAVRNLLGETHRILKPGGGIRITAPDTSLDYRAYRCGDLHFWYWRSWYSKPRTWEALYTMPLSQASIHQLFLHRFASQLAVIDADQSAPRKVEDAEVIEVFSKMPMEEALDFFTKQCEFNPRCPQNHINWWTHDKLTAMLREAGFSDSYRSGYGQSAFPALRDTSLFDNTHPPISLYIEAVKS